METNFRKSLLILAVLACAWITRAQDPNYSQWLNAPLYYNPAFTGLNSGLKAKFTYRDQWPNLPVDYKTMYFSADLGDRSLPGSGGLGLIVNSDNQSFGFIRTLAAAITLSARIQIKSSVIAQVGLKAGIVQKRLNWDDFVFSDELSDKFGKIFNTNLPPPDQQKRLFPDFGVGGMIQFAAMEGSMVGTVGLAVDHMFEPDESFYSLDRSRLPRKYVGHMDLLFLLGNDFEGRYGVRGFGDPLKLNPGILFQNQNGLNSIQLGLNLLKYNIYMGCYYQSTAVTDHTSALVLLAGYRYIASDDAVVKLMYTYDLELAGNLVGTGGAHEISLILEFSKLGLSGGNRYEECPALPSRGIKFTRLECSPF